LFAIISTPPNFLWQQLLESWYPAQVPVEGGEKEKKTTKFSKINTVKKFVTDQLLGGPINTALFLAAMGYFRGLTGEQLVAFVREVSSIGTEARDSG
jgi:protein Mpv17